MNEFLEKIKEEYLDFIHFKQEQDEEIEKWEEEKRKLEADMDQYMEESEHSQGDYEDEKYIIEECKRKSAKNEIKGKIESIKERISIINQQIDKRRKPLENIIDEEIQKKRNIIERTKKEIKEIEEKISEIEQYQLQTQKEITDVKKLEAEEVSIDTKNVALEILNNNLNEENNKLEKEHYELKKLKELCLNYQNDLNKLEEVKKGLYKKFKRQVKEETDKPNNEQEIKTDISSEENKKNNHEIKTQKHNKKRHSIIASVIEKIRKGRSKGKRETTGWIPSRLGYIPDNKRERQNNTISDEAFYNSVRRPKTKGESENFSERMKKGVQPVQDVPKIPEHENKGKLDLDNEQGL